MKRFFFFSIFLLIFVATIIAQQPVVAKLPALAMADPLTPGEASSVEEVFNNLLSEARNVRFINQLILDKGMRDYQFQPRDWADFEKTLALGEVLNIDWAVRPQIQKKVWRNVFGTNESEIIVTAALLNIRTQKITCTTPLRLKDTNEARNKMGPLISEITQIITSGTGGLTQPSQPTAVYKVGDRGPAGGWVFYDKGSYSDGWRYIEVAPMETEKKLPRAKIVEKIKGTDSGGRIAMGTGKQYTEIILQSNQDYQIVKAAKICASLELNWFKDWFLPCHSELNTLATIPTPQFGGPNLGGFNDGYYQVSSTYTGDDTVRFGSVNANRQDDLFVRAVRCF